MASVGRSWRTPAKLGIVKNIVGREVGVANHHPAIYCLEWFDLTAGDGVTDGSEVWWESCTPGIYARYALDSVKPVREVLFEEKRATVGRLLESLEAQLPLLRSAKFPEKVYERTGLWTWEAPNVKLAVVHGSGAEVSVDHIKPWHSVLVLNDPNAITDWAMRSGFCEEVEKRTPWFRNVSTMGCNANGLKRGVDRDDREDWFRCLEDQEAGLPNHRDLLLVAIRPDSHQWAYLLCEPVKWRDKVEQQVCRSIAGVGKLAEMAWFRTQPDGYGQLKRELFLTRRELGESA